MRVALVTGAGRNIGRAAAAQLAREGWQVAVADLDAALAEESARAVGGFARQVDIASADSVGAMVEAVLARFGRIDALVNNAAKFTELAYRPFDEIPQAEWDAVLHTNLTGTLHCIRACVPDMKKRRWGRIVNVSSGTYRMGRPNFLHYVTSKAGLMGMSRSLARELGAHGITVNTVLPGVVFTDHQKQRLPEDYRRMILGLQCIPAPLAPEALAGPIAFLCSEAAGFVTGQELAVDGGLTHGG
ncbi:MAG TPA: SDR family oxidoreductase [Burkholderiales bacterium]|nr:SDR family oxidoreductase [Burkholderiales bacterium]